MPKYDQTDGDSGILAYETADEAIIIQFRDGSIYLYDHIKPGKAAVEEMKRLAAAGAGLTTYINTTVRQTYARKIR